MKFRMKRRYTKVLSGPGRVGSYTKGQSCIARGGRHNYVHRGKYDKCSTCASVRHHKSR